MKNNLKRTGNEYVLFSSVLEHVGLSGKGMVDVTSILSAADSANTNVILELENLIQKESDVNKIKELNYAKSKAKMKLPCVLFSCNTGKSKSEIVSYSANIVLDFDHVENIDNHFKALDNDTYTRLVFVSPSGAGLKVVVELDFPFIEASSSDVKSFHEFGFSCLVKYYKEKFNLEADPSGKNINRLCFLPSGVTFSQNDDAVVVGVFENWMKSRNVKDAEDKTKLTKEIMDKTILFTPCASSKTILEICLEYTTNHKIDLFESYEDWLALGYICYKAFGDDGVDMFNNISKSSTKYDLGELNNQWAIIAKTYDSVKCKNIKFITKKMFDSGFQPKREEDKLFKDSTWKLTQYYEMQGELGVKILKDEVTNEFYFETDGKIELIDDELLNQHLTTLRMKYTEKFTSTNLSEYMFARNNITYRNFIREYVESLPFTTFGDGEAEFMKIVDNIDTHASKELTANILKRWGIGVFINLYHRGYYDEILVLKSTTQGLGKTTWITQHLLKGFSQWVTTNFQFTSEKDNLKLLTNKLFVYDMENTNLKKSDNAMIKKITSTQEVQIRLPYKKLESKLRRICSFIFDTNESEIYNDLTGARRYLILDIEAMNIFDEDGGELKKINYDVVWGWLYNQFKEGVKPQTIELPGIDEVRNEAQMTTDLGHIINKLFVPDANGQLSLDEIEKKVKEYYKYHDKPFADNGYNVQQFGKHLAKFNHTRVRVQNGPQKQVRMYNIKFVPFKQNNSFDKPQDIDNSFLKKYDDDL